MVYHCRNKGEREPGREREREREREVDVCRWRDKLTEIVFQRKSLLPIPLKCLVHLLHTLIMSQL